MEQAEFNIYTKTPVWYKYDLDWSNSPHCYLKKEKIAELENVTNALKYSYSPECAENMKQ